MSFRFNKDLKTSKHLVCVHFITRGVSHTILPFAVQLAICIEKKCEMNEDFQDCVGSNEHAHDDMEVTWCFYLKFLSSVFLLLLTELNSGDCCLLSSLALSASSMDCAGRQSSQRQDNQ